MNGIACVLDATGVGIPQPRHGRSRCTDVGCTPSSTMNTLRLIVSDDDDGFRALLADVLQEAGYEVLKATNGAQALQQCERYSVAAAIIDLSRPAKAGLEAIFDLRHRFPGLRIVAVCGRRENADHCLRMAALIGADATLAKPFGTAEMLETVRRVLDHDSVPAGA